MRGRNYKMIAMHFQDFYNKILTNSKGYKEMCEMLNLLMLDYKKH